MSEMTVWTRARWSGLADQCARLPAAVRSAATGVLAALLSMVIAARGLAGLALISYGAWLAYRPAGFVVAGVLLLADRVVDERRERDR
jgi:hypothetical protein